MGEKTSVIILTSRGPRHSYFCREIAKHFDVRGIVVDDRYHFKDRLRTFLISNGYNPFTILKRVYLKKIILKYDRRDIETESKAFPAEKNGAEFPEGVPVLLSPDPNNEHSVRWIRDRSPDVIVAFGTRIIKDPVLRLARLGALNLHTGLSPYYRGGQCTFWALYHGDPDHVGVTVHHLNQKIDGGDIVFTARPEIVPEDTVRSIECKLVKLATEGMIDAIRDMAAGKKTGTPQEKGGKLFLSREFTLEKRLEFEGKMANGWLGTLLKNSDRNRKSVRE